MKNKVKSSKSIKITQIKSTIGKNSIQKKHLLSLGLKKIGSTKEIVMTKPIEGLVNKIKHLILIEKGWFHA